MTAVSCFIHRSLIGGGSYAVYVSNLYTSQLSSLRFVDLITFVIVSLRMHSIKFIISLKMLQRSVVLMWQYARNILFVRTVNIYV